jgi:aspartate carbamoyltransferase catalytic subunit
LYHVLVLLVDIYGVIVRTPKHILSVADFEPEFIANICKLAGYFKNLYSEPQNALDRNYINYWSETLNGKRLVSLFYEPSTRTRFSFEAAMQNLGGHVIGTENAEIFSSATKGESLTDSIRVVSGYADVVTLRHKERGAAHVAASTNTVPIINAGDGDGEHPTQALLDFFTILEHFSGQDDLTVTFVGDLRWGRTVHSLAYLFTKLYATELGMVSRMFFVGPEELQIPLYIKDSLDKLKGRGVRYRVYNEMAEEAIRNSDVIYMTRTQYERHGKKRQCLDDTPARIIRSRNLRYSLTEQRAQNIKDNAIIMHPLPRNSELPEVIDTLPQARYFEQASRNGLYVRMALLLWVLGKLNTRSVGYI